MMMSKRRKVYLAVAGLIAVAIVPVSLLSTRSAGASTTACGSPCTSPYNESLGASEVLTVSPSSVPDTASSVVMSSASTSNSDQDWTPEAEGTVANAVLAGVISARLNMLYMSDTLLEYQWAPDGVPSGKCLANTMGDLEYNGTEIDAPTLTVVLAACGVTSQSLWIVDQDNLSDGYVDLINAGYATTTGYLVPNDSFSDELTNPFAEPAVLTINSSDDVVLAPLSEIGGDVSSTQMWAAFTSADQSALRARIEKAK
jgi:hypothetical protein